MKDHPTPGGVSGTAIGGITAAVTAAYEHRLVLVSPPRTGSTAVARLLWGHSAITHHCHEPFEARYWSEQGEESIEVILRHPMDVESGARVELAQVPPGAGLLLKDMTFQLGEDGINRLHALATAPLLFVMGDPRLSTNSRLRIVRELYDADTFAAAESGWDALAAQVEHCRSAAIPYVLLDSGDLRSDPVGIVVRLLAALGLTEESGLETWTPRPGLRLVSPEVGALMSDARREDDPFYRRVLSSRGIEPMPMPDWEQEREQIDAVGLGADVDRWIAHYRRLRADPALLGARHPETSGHIRDP